MTAEWRRILIVGTEVIALDLLGSVLAEKFATERTELSHRPSDQTEKKLLALK